MIIMPGTKILLTEGEKIIADELCKILAEAQYEVDLAYDGQMCKQLFDAYPYDLALIDFHLPDINGCELCYYIRNKDMNIPLLMLASAASDNKFEGFEAGVDDYIVLSEDFRELLMRIRALEKRSFRPIVPHNRIGSGDIIVDLDSKEVTKGDRLIMLTAKEFFILEYLIRNKNRIVSRDEIVLNIWGSGFSSKEGRLPAFINSLRKKIEDDAYPKCIYTVTGKGYLLTEKGK
jgi:two-component system, OmpR family, copper resistance phosphate regulon response regulator CusR